jgi:hypothetical protein
LHLQLYLAKVYRLRDLDLRQVTGGTDGVCPEYNVTGILPPASNIGQQIDSIKRGRKTRDIGLILNLLCQEGFIPIGRYVIDMTTPPDPIHKYTQLLQKHADPNHPECKAFRKTHDDVVFQRRADTLDKLTIEYAQLENTSEGT